MSKLLILLIFLLSFVACSPTPEPPSVNSPVAPVNVEACRNASMNLRDFKAPGVRALIGCLNGNNHSLQPYKDFLDAMSDDDLNTLLEINNKHVFRDAPRVNQALDLLDRMHAKGYMGALMKATQVMVEDGVVDKLLPVMSRFFESDSQAGRIDPALTGFNQYVARLIDSKVMTNLLSAAGHMSGGFNARVLAYLMAKDDSASVMKTPQIVDLLSDQLIATLSDNTLHSFLTYVSDPQLNPANGLRVLSDDEQSDLSDLLSFLPLGSTSGGTRMQRLRAMVIGADRPLDCFANGRGERRAGNLFHMIGSESMKRAAGVESDKFFLKTIPLLLLMTKDSCNYSNDVINNIEIDKEIARLGYADGHRALFRYVLGGNRFEEVTRAFENEHLTAMAPVMEELSVRGGMSFALQILTRDITPSDAAAVSDALVYLLAEDMHGQKLTDWIRTNIPGPSSDAMFAVLGGMPEADRGLVNLSLTLARAPGQEVALRNLKNALTRFTFNSSYEHDITSVVTKIFKNESTRRGELKELAQALVKSMGDSRGGLGDLINVYGQATGLAQETPVQEIISETLKDQELVDRVTPIFWRLLRDQKFINAINFTGRLAGAGELEKLIQFAVDLFKTTEQPGLPPDNHLSQYQSPAGHPADVAATVQPPVPKPPRDQYKPCIDLRGSLFDFQGQNLHDALKCTNVDGANPELALIADHLQASGSLNDADDLLKVILSSSPYTLGTLNEIETLFRSGELAKLLQLFVISADANYQLPYRLDGVLNDAFRHKGMPQALRLTGRMAQLKDLSKAAGAAIDVWTTPPHKIFHSQNNYRLQVSEPDKIRAQIHVLLPDLNDQQVEQAYQIAREDFETHNEAWMHQEGSFPVLDDAAWKNEVVAFLQDMLRTTDLHDLIASLQDIARTMNPAKFLSEAIDDQRVVLQHDDDGHERIHILTLLDQLEELTVDSDFDFNVVGMNVGHVGVKFQLAVAKATDLVAEMDHQHSLTKVALKAAEFLHKQREANHFKNMLANYDGLSKIAETGDLRIFQRLYQGLYNATPAQYRDKADSRLNHMAALNHINRLGVFSNLTVALVHAKRQGQLETIVNGLMGLTMLIKENDIEPLRQAITALLQRARQGDTAPIEYLLDKLLAIPQNNEGYAEFKDTLFHVVPALYRLNVDPTGAFKALPAVVAQPRTFHDAIDGFVNDLQDPAGALFKIGANMLTLDDQTLNAFREVATMALVDEPSGENDFPAAVSILADGYAFRPDEYSKIWQTWKAYINDSRVTAFQPPQLFKTILNTLDGQSGIGDGVAYLLLDDNRKQELIRLGYHLSQAGDVAQLSRVLVRAINDSDVDAGLHFIFDNLGSSSVGYPNRGLQIRSAPPPNRNRRHHWWW